MREGKGAILLVEDEEDICWALSRILSTMDYATRAALSGRDALQLAEHVPFDLGIVDAKLPDIDGIELAARLREARAELPLILISGYFYDDDVAVRDSVSKNLFCTFASKPFRASDIKDAVRLGLRSRDARSPA